MLSDPPKVLVSSCLSGKLVRYDRSAKSLSDRCIAC